MKPSLILKIGDVPAVAITRKLIMAANHVAAPYTTATVANPDGSEYIGDGPAWFRIETPNGPVEEKAGNFNFEKRIKLADGDYATTWRALPLDVVEPSFKRPAVNELVVIYSRVSNTQNVARINRIDTGVAYTDYRPLSGDSGSIVRAQDGTFIGIISGADLNSSGKIVGSFLTVPDSMITDPTLTHVPGTGADGATGIKPTPQPSPIVTAPATTTPPAVPDSTTGNTGPSVGMSVVLRQDTKGDWYRTNQDSTGWIKLPPLPTV